VPIPVIKQACDKQCCEITFLPLTLAYGKTAHTFQGQSAGPQHPVEVIIVQPGTRQFEGTCPGLFYVMLSRATTIGNRQDRADSAIFFHTNEMNYDRITNITMNKKQNTPFKRVQDRHNWIQHLNKHIKNIRLTDDEKGAIISWASTTRITPSHLSKVIDDTTWRTTNTINY
jgi:hypothetical protein